MLTISMYGSDVCMFLTLTHVNLFNNSHYIEVIIIIKDTNNVIKIHINIIKLYPLIKLPKALLVHET